MEGLPEPIGLEERRFAQQLLREGVRRSSQLAPIEFLVHFFTGGTRPWSMKQILGSLEAMSNLDPAYFNANSVVYQAVRNKIGQNFRNDYSGLPRNPGGE